MVQIICKVCGGTDSPSNRIVFSETSMNLFHVTCMPKGDAGRDDFVHDEDKKKVEVKDDFEQRDGRDNL